MRDHEIILLLAPEKKTNSAMCDHNIALLLAPETKLVLLLKTPPSAKSTVH